MSLEAIRAQTSQKDPVHVNQKTDNFLRKVAKLVAQIYTLFSEISQHDKKEIQRLEFKYTLATHDSASLTKAQGKVALTTSIVGIGILAASLGISNRNDQLFVQKISEQAPALSQLFTMHQAANGKTADSIAAIQYQKLQDKSSKSQTDGNIKDSFAQVLQAELQRHRAASSANG